MAAEAEASREARAKVTKDFVFQLLSGWLSWKDLVNKSPTVILLLAANTRSCHQIADFRWKILSATCQSGRSPITWKSKALPLKSGEKKYDCFSQGDCCRWWDARLQSPEVGFVRSFLRLYWRVWPVQMETMMGVPFLGSNTAALFSRHLFQGSFYDNRAVACSFTAAISPNPQFHILRFHT